MRRELVFGIYLVLVAFSVLCMGLILLLLAKREEGKRRLYQAARNFSLSVFLLILLYLGFYYQDTVAQEPEVSLLWRLAHPREGKAAAEHTPWLPPVVLLVSLLALDSLYALFLGVQSAGLFGGPAYLASRGLSYADWARSGFFQMVRVTVVNLSVLLGAITWTKRERGFGAIRLAAAVLTGESFLLLGSAAWRMSLYVSAYGLSFKRCMTYWGMAVMAALFAFAAGKLARPERSFCRLAFPFLLAAWLLVAYLPIDSIVARDQVRRGGGDVEYLLYALSYDALGYLDADAEKVVRDGDGGFRRLGGLIGERRAQAAEECAAWESWNLSAYLASRGGTE